MTSRVRAALKREVPWPLILSYLLCSALCGAMIRYRFTLTGLSAYAWLAVPNLVLAWIPFALAIAIRVANRLDLRSPLLFVPLGLLWLLFFPNAPYIVTDLIHLIDNWQAFSIYYDVALLALAAFTGLGLGFGSLLMLQELVETSWGRLAGWSFCTLTWLLTAIGIYLGRVERWNSWDALHSPLLILADLARALRGGEPLLIMVVYSIVNMALYVAFRYHRSPKG